MTTRGLDGPGVAAMGVGALLLYSGIRGFSVIVAIENIISGKDAASGQKVNTIADSSSGGSPSSGSAALSAAQGNIPANAASMYAFFRAHGLTHNAAAGVIGNIEGESGGNPESVGTGGNGLIGWTPPRAGFVTGNPGRDLMTQLNAVMQYIATNGSVGDINRSATSPAAAARHFCFNYERPANPAGDSPLREASANAVARRFTS